MSTLHVHNFPENLYARIQAVAGEQGRSLDAEVIALLDQALKEREQRENQKEILASMRHHRFKPAAGTPDSETLIQEDRER